MINLLPYDLKKELKASRINSILLSCILILCFAIGFLILTCATTFLLIENSRTINEELARTSQTTNASSNSTQQVQTATDNLDTTKQILEQQISYSALLQAFGGALPTGVILESLNVNNDNINQPLNLQIRATSNDKISEMTSKFQSSTVFTSYELVSSKTDNSNVKYPVTANIKLSIRKGTF